MKVILAQPRGYCAGVVRAIDIVERAPAETRTSGLRAPRDRAQPVMSLKASKARGARFVEDLSDVPCRRNHDLQRARGVARRGGRRADSRPFGSRRHPPPRGQGSQGRSALRRSRSHGDPHRSRRASRGGRHAWPTHVDLSISCKTRPTCSALDIPSDTPLAYITQTTLSVDDTRSTIMAIKKRFTRRRRSRHPRHPPRHSRIARQPCAELSEEGRPHPCCRRDQQLQFQSSARNRC